MAIRTLIWNIDNFDINKIANPTATKLLTPSNSRLAARP